jgi:exoribonuclease R
VVGKLLEFRERERGGVSLPLPEQEIVPTDDGWRLEFRAPLPVEGWNAQISLLTGMAAADIMLYGQLGVLRRLPPADAGSLRKLRATAKALGIAWPAELDYPEFVRSLDPSEPAHAATLNACTMLFRGAGYLAFDGEMPAEAEHSALATDYAHCTAPLRRLVDRYVGEICLAMCAGTPVPGWVVEALPALPQEMAGAERRAKKYERSILDLVEVVLLAARVGEVFRATVVEVDDDRRHGTVVLEEPAVEAKVSGEALPLGRQLQVRLVTADLERGAVAFERVS